MEQANPARLKFAEYVIEMKNFIDRIRNKGIGPNGEVPFKFEPDVVMREYDNNRPYILQIYLYMTSMKMEEVIRDQSRRRPGFKYVEPDQKKTIRVKMPGEVRKTLGSYAVDYAEFMFSIIANETKPNRLPRPEEMEEIMKDAEIFCKGQEERVRPFRRRDLALYDDIGQEMNGMIDEENEEESVLYEETRDKYLAQELDFYWRRDSRNERDERKNQVERAVRTAYGRVKDEFPAIWKKVDYKRRTPESQTLVIPNNVMRPVAWMLWNNDAVVNWAGQFIHDKQQLTWLAYKHFIGVSLLSYLDSNQWMIDKVPFGVYMQLKSHLNRVMNTFEGLKYYPD